jgi:hypothetical protein
VGFFKEDEMTKFAYPTERDLKFDRTQSEILKRVDFVLDDATFSNSITDGAAIVICLLGIIALLGMLS